MSNEWWDPQKKREVTSVEDDNTTLVGSSESGPGVSPHNLLASTLGDEMKLATHGRSKVFGISLKDRAAVLPAGFAGSAYWIDKDSGAWITSTYYTKALPGWVQQFDNSKRADKYLNREWKDENGNLVAKTTANGKGFYAVVGGTAFANDFELEFARELIVYEHLGSGPATDLLAVSLSANDILGHQVGPDAPAMRAMAMALDRQLSDFFAFLGKQIGLANVWIALSADHGVAPVPAETAKLHIPAAGLSGRKMGEQINTAVAERLSSGRKADYVTAFDYPLAWLDQEAFSPLHLKEEDAERAVGEAMQQLGLRGYYTRVQLARGDVPNTPLARKYLNSYSGLGGWYVMGVPAPYTVGSTSGTDHASPYSYDTHVPLALYGLPFQAGTYRAHAEPVDLAVTLAALLGINAPTHASGRVLTESLAVGGGGIPSRSRAERSGESRDHNQPAAQFPSGRKN
jgi:hypothetical protein